MSHSTPQAQLLCYALEPWPFPPGSEEKIAVLQLRAALRLSLFVTGDYAETFDCRAGAYRR